MTLYSLGDPFVPYLCAYITSVYEYTGKTRPSIGLSDLLTSYKSLRPRQRVSVASVVSGVTKYKYCRFMKGAHLFGGSSYEQSCWCGLVAVVKELVISKHVCTLKWCVEGGSSKIVFRGTIYCTTLHSLLLSSTLSSFLSTPIY